MASISPVPGFLTPLWDTGRVKSADSIHRAYAGEELEARTRYCVRARAWDNHGDESAWETGFFETGLIGAPWQAEWVTCDLPKDPPDYIPPRMLRRWVTVDKPVHRARAYATALGVYNVGTPFLCHVLSENGRADLSYDLLFQDGYPSRLYQVKMGATTVWEHWDGIKPDGSMWSADKNSFNHYAYGSVGDWLYKVAAGLRAAEDGPGYRAIRLRPHITERLEYVDCWHESVYGRVCCTWKRRAGELTLEVEIPSNATATLHLPTTHPDSITEEGGTAMQNRDVTVRGPRNGECVLELGSGRYVFGCKCTVWR